jgi:XTP/dITP diphosphohydrolase
MERKRVLIFASGNSNKIKELRQMLGENFEIISLKDLGIFEDIPETGMSFRDNALLKASYLHEKFGFDCIAEDSGLEIDALSGEPGIYSARYAGDEKNHAANIRKVLEKLKPFFNRKARFRSVIAVLVKGQPHFFEGVIEGSITHSPQGDKGFGYDPIFVPDGHETTFGEMSDPEKNAISHRAIAVKAMVEFLKITSQK